MAARVCVSLVLYLATATSGLSGEPSKPARPDEVVCHCQFVELSPRAVEDFYAAADLVKARSGKKSGPEFGVCLRAEEASIKVRKAERATISEFPAVAASREKPATVGAGGEFPILIPVADGRVEVKWRWYGYRANVVPRWLDTGRLQLDITPEIARPDFSHAVTSRGLTIPGLTTRRAHARVEMNLGETAVMNLGPELTFSDDDDLTPTKPDRPSASGTSVPAAAERAAKRETVTLFLVTPTAATTSPVSREAK